jgi:hypothetical protein
MPLAKPGFEKLNGIYQYTGTQRRRPAQGWNTFPEVSAFVEKDGSTYRRAAVYVGEPMLLPEEACTADSTVAEHEALASAIEDGDVYTAGCRSMHALIDIVGDELSRTVGAHSLWRHDWALCQGASFHADVGFGEAFVLVLVSGTPGELHLPRLGCKIPMSQGDWVIFDSAEPHGFTNDGEEQFDAKSNMRKGLTRFLNIGIRFDEVAAVAEAFAFNPDALRGALRTDAFEVDELTGTARAVRTRRVVV